MAKKRFQPVYHPADIFLGERIRDYRVARDMTLLDLGRKINETFQQVEKFEAGQRIPAPKIERISEAFGSLVEKKIIRRIVNARRQDEQFGDMAEELHQWYEAAFPEDEIDDI